MSLISSFKRALGFPGEFDNEEEDLENEDFTDDDFIDDPDPALDDINTDSSSPENISGATTQRPPLSDEELKDMSADIFDAVLKYFNSYQPELVQRCIDLDAQRAMIIGALDQSLKARLSSLADRACRSGESRWAEKQKRMGEELMKLKSEYNNVRQQREEFQSAQLSATRQKRALNERINDLEAQVTALEAEREQYQLENRSMASRLRAMGGSQPSDTPDAGTANAMQEENASLKKEIESLKETIARHEAETKRLQSLIDESGALHSEASPTREEIEEYREIRKQMGALRQAKELSESHIVRLNQEIKECNGTINRLQKQLADSAIKVEEQKSEIESLNSTIEANLYAHASAEAELRKQLGILQGAPEEAQLTMHETHPASTEQKPGKNKRRRKSSLSKNTNPDKKQIKISAIDELMDNTDWFVAPEPVPLKKDPEVEENFGYKEPMKKPDNIDDDRQLTLW